MNPELEDMREHVPFLESYRERCIVDLDAQLTRTRAVFGENESSWPASSYVMVKGLREAVGEASDRLAAAREYLEELEAGCNG